MGATASIVTLAQGRAPDAGASPDGAGHAADAEAPPFARATGNESLELARLLDPLLSR